MSVRRLWKACLRGWYLVLVGVVLTSQAGWAAWHPQPVYWSRTDATFLAPLSSTNPNALGITSDSIISTAGIVQRKIDNGDPGLATSSPEVTLYDQGIFDGHLIRLPDSGGQWTHNFEKAVLRIEVTGSDPHEVQRRMTGLVAQVRDELARLQLNAKARPQNQITLEILPSQPSVLYVGGSRVRAIVVTGLLGFSLTLTGAALLDRRRFGEEHGA